MHRARGLRRRRRTLAALAALPPEQRPLNLYAAHQVLDRLLDAELERLDELLPILRRDAELPPSQLRRKK